MFVSENVLAVRQIENNEVLKNVHKKDTEKQDENTKSNRWKGEIRTQQNTARKCTQGEVAWNGTQHVLMWRSEPGRIVSCRNAASAHSISQ